MVQSLTSSLLQVLLFVTNHDNVFRLPRMGIELMDSHFLSMIGTSINQCLSVHIQQYGWLEALPWLFTWVIYISGPWLLWFKYTWQESFSTCSENPVKKNNCQGSGSWTGKLWVILILLTSNMNLSIPQFPCFSTVPFSLLSFMYKVISYCRHFFFTAMLYTYGRFLSRQLVNTVTSDHLLYKVVSGLIKYQMFICYFLYIAGRFSTSCNM